MKLRGKILLPVILILVIAVSSISAINYFLARQTVTEMIDTEMNAAISNILAAERLSNEITGIVTFTPSPLTRQNYDIAATLTQNVNITVNPSSGSTPSPTPTPTPDPDTKFASLSLRVMPVVTGYKLVRCF